MCALFGWLDYKGIVPYRILKELTQALANAAEERGTDAAGISYIKNGKVTIFKHPKPAHKIRFNAPEGTTAIMGHTRMATQGDKRHNFNNHPFSGIAGNTSFAFAHNGVLWNDRELRRDKKLPDTQIETDSYIAVQLIEKQDELNFDTLKDMAEAVHGSFCFTILDEYGKLYIIKGSNPMTIVHFEALGLYVYASTETILSKALKKVGLHKFQCTPIKMSEGDMLSIDRCGKIEAAAFSPYVGSPFGKYGCGSWLDDDYCDRCLTAHEEMLLEMCHIFGIDEDDVFLLLDYGFSVDEIEDMMNDYTLITDTLNALKGVEDYSDCLVEV